MGIISHYSLTINIFYLRVKAQEVSVNILIIGNGFDLAHHLPTQYSDFLDFINAFLKPDGSDYSDFIETIKTDKPKIYAEIEDDIRN